MTDAGGATPSAGESSWAAERMRLAMGCERYAEIGRRTALPSESVRRYMTNGAPSLGFVAKVCEVWDLNANWVLFGLGPRQGRTLTPHVVCEIKPDGLAHVLERLLRPDDAAANGRRGEGSPRSAWQ